MHGLTVYLFQVTLKSVIKALSIFFRGITNVKRGLGFHTSVPLTESLETNGFKMFYFMNLPAQKIRFSIKGFFSKCEEIRRRLRADLLTFTKKIYYGKLHLCAIITISFNDLLNFMS